MRFGKGKAWVGGFFFRRDFGMAWDFMEGWVVWGVCEQAAFDGFTDVFWSSSRVSPWVAHPGRALRSGSLLFLLGG